MVFSFLLVASLAVGQPQVPKLAQPVEAKLPKLAQSPVAEKVNPPKAHAQMSDDYAAARSVAIGQGKPIVIFVRMDKRPIAGAAAVRVDHLDGYDTGPVIVVGVPDTKHGMRWSATLPVNATDLRIRQAAGLEQPSAIPFFKRLQDRRDERRTADADVPASGRWYTEAESAKAKVVWPKGMSLPIGLKFYWPTKLSQRIAITDNRPTNDWYPDDRDDVFSNAPTSFNPNRHDPRWVAPGGLVGVHGWESYTAAAIPSQVKAWTQPVPIANGGTIPGGILWEYPPKTFFADLLVHGGKPFELRYRQKRDDGSWESYVAWKNADARPAGYFGAGKKCAVCHDLAGGSEQYGITIRGKDTVFSYLPFDLK